MGYKDSCWPNRERDLRRYAEAWPNDQGFQSFISRCVGAMVRAGKKKDTKDYRPKVRRYTPEEDDVIRKLWRNPLLSAAEIGERIGRSEEGIRYRVTKLDLPAKTPGPKSQFL